MLVCFCCNRTAATSLKHLHQHFRNVHGLSERYDRYICAQSGCGRPFGDKYTFNNHVVRCYSDCFVNSDSIENDRHVFVTENLPDLNNVANSSKSSETNQHEKCYVNVKELACKFICQCKSKMSTVQNVQDAIAMCTDLCQMLFGDVVDDVKRLRKNIVGICEDEFDKIEKSCRPT